MRLDCLCSCLGYFIMKQIPLTQGKFAQVDDEDFDFLNQWKWHAQKCRNDKFYAARTERKILMHRVIMKTPEGLDVDHIDNNGLNCQKSNLRNCTKRQNTIHSISVGISKYKGVKRSSYIPKKSTTKRRWETSIKVDGKYIFLGHFENELDAAKVYNQAAEKYHGEFAVLNSL